MGSRSEEGVFEDHHWACWGQIVARSPVVAISEGADEVNVLLSWSEGIPTKSGEESLSPYLRKLRKNKIIDDETFYKIVPSGSSPGVLYGLIWPFQSSFHVVVLQKMAEKCIKIQNARAQLLFCSYKYLLLTEFEGRTVSYGPSFFLLDLWPKREVRGP